MGLHCCNGRERERERGVKPFPFLLPTIWPVPLLPATVQHFNQPWEYFHLNRSVWSCVCPFVLCWRCLVNRWGGETPTAGNATGIVITHMEWMEVKRRILLAREQHSTLWLFSALGFLYLFLKRAIDISLACVYCSHGLASRFISPWTLSPWLDLQKQMWPLITISSCCFLASISTCPKKFFLCHLLPPSQSFRFYRFPLVLISHLKSLNQMRWLKSCCVLSKYAVPSVLNCAHEMGISCPYRSSMQVNCQLIYYCALIGKASNLKLEEVFCKTTSGAYFGVLTCTSDWFASFNHVE